MNTTQFGNAMEVTARTVERWEADQRGLSIQQLQRAAVILACSPMDLLGNGDDEPSKAVA